MSNTILNKAKDIFIQEQVEDSFDDYKFIMSVLYDYFKKEVNKMSEKEFKNYFLKTNHTVNDFSKYLMFVLNLTDKRTLKDFLSYLGT